MVPFILSGVALGAAIWIALRRGLSTPASVVLSLLAFLWGALSLLLLGSHHFTGAGINLAVIYHLEFGFSGAGFDEYQREILMLTTGVVLCMALTVVLQHRLRAAHSRRGAQWPAICIVLALASLGLHPASADLGEIYAARWGWISGDSAGPGVRYLDPHLLPSDSAPLNLAFIYLESVERTYLDESEFPGLTPNLNRLRTEGIDFSDLQQLPGTDFTVGGMVASQCGLPLVSNSQGNSQSGGDEFLPGARCMGDLLGGLGYRLSFVGGAPLHFAGKGAFYKSHGFDRALGQEELLAELGPAPVSSWGLYDDQLLEVVLDEIEQFAAEESPYAVFALTLDTHHPRGHATPACADRPYRDGSEPTLNAVHCADYLIGNLVRSLRSMPLGERLLIVLASDHLAMRNTVWDRLESMERRNLFLLLPPGGASAGSVHRAGSALDMGATVLTAMGHRHLGLGYGRDLLGPAPTLVENSRDPKAFATSLAPDLVGFWRYPGLESGLSVDPTVRSLQAGTRTLTYPVLLRLDESLRIREAIFDRAQPQRLPGYLSVLPDGNRYLLLDQCPAATDLGIRVGDLDEQCQSICLFGGRTAHATTVVIPMCEQVGLSPGALRTITQGGAALSPDLHEAQRSRLTAVYDSGASDNHRLDWGLAGPWQGWQVRSSGYGAGFSSLQSPELATGTTLQLDQRALAVFEMNPEGEPEQLATFDLCGAGMGDSDAAESLIPLSDLLDARGNAATLLLVAHDSANCGSAAPLDRFFAGSPGALWRSLQFRQPYVALISKGLPIQEWLGTPERSLLIRFDSHSADAP